MTKKKSGGLGETLRTVFYAVLVALVVRTVAYEPFNIPSGSMIPTLLVGDYLFVSKFSYGYSRHSFPFSAVPLDGRVFASDPQRGDVAVFKFPGDNSTDYIKRIVGLPGDTVRMQLGRLVINGDVVERERIEDFVIRDHHGNVRRLGRFVETLPNGVSYEILEESDFERYDNTALFRVPEGHYFMMGDNRDHSEDSRGSVGFVPFENMVGEAQVLFFSADGSARLWEVWRWPFAIRWDRLFEPVR